MKCDTGSVNNIYFCYPAYSLQQQNLSLQNISEILFDNQLSGLFGLLRETDLKLCYQVLRPVIIFLCMVM